MFVLYVAFVFFCHLGEDCEIAVSKRYGPFETKIRLRSHRRPVLDRQGYDPKESGREINFRRCRGNGSRKTCTMDRVIHKLNRLALTVVYGKTLAV